MLLKRARVVGLSVAVGLMGLLAPRPSVAASSLEPAGWDAGLRLREPDDLNPDPRILEINLAARVAKVDVAPGKTVEAWTYDGGLPGPLIRLRVGDRLIVHFTNELPQPTTIHWHGLRVPIQMDGVPDISQPPVETGETFTYDFTVPDAGLFWYHPHVMSAAQVGFGLYGPLLVDDPAEQVGVADEVVIVLSDIGFDRHGVLEPADSGGPAGMVFGREGNHVLLNGRTRPTMRARAGVPQRWRIVNTAKSRFFLLDLEGLPFTTIGGDGGLQEYAEENTTVLVTAGERVDLLVTPTGKPGSELVLRSMLYNRGYGSVEYRSVEELMTIALTDEAPYKAPPLPRTQRVIEPLSQLGATPVTMEFTLELLGDGSSAFGINGIPYERAKPFMARLGETQIWTLRNKTKWAHPFHLHGYFFQVLDEQNRPVKPMAWKDTINVPMEETVRVIVRFEDREGTWMFHCHILDHAEGGLMGTVHVGSGVPVTHSHKK